MKSAREWLDEDWELTEKLIIDIQEDALMEAALQALDWCILPDHGGCTCVDACEQILLLIPPDNSDSQK